MQYEAKAAGQCRKVPVITNQDRYKKREQTEIFTHEAWQTDFAETTIS